MPKAKKVRHKRYTPGRRQLGALLGGANFPYTPKQLDDMERALWMHAATLRTAPEEDSWLYLICMTAIFHRLSYALESQEMRRLTFAAWRNLDFAYRHWKQQGEVLSANLNSLDDMIPAARAMMPGFTQYEFATARDYVKKTGLVPPKEDRECVNLLPQLQSR